MELTAFPRSLLTSLPTEMDSFRILLYVLIFLLSAFGNLLIIIVLAMNKRMRTVTNSFLLSLAVSDLMMAIFCMPFTLIPNILEDFIFGAAMCKTVSYFMGKRGRMLWVVFMLVSAAIHFFHCSWGLSRGEEVALLINRKGLLAMVCCTMCHSARVP